MCKPATSRPARARGIALIEVIIFMVVIALAAGAILSVFARTNRSSAELLANRQALAIAEAMLTEVLAAPFTTCDLNDANFVGPGACASMPESLPGGPEAGELRLGPSFFDNVNDYNGFVIPTGGMVDRSATVVAGLNAYSLGITVAPVAAGAWNGVPGADMALVTVTVSAAILPAPLALQGMRARYAPRLAPS